MDKPSMGSIEAMPSVGQSKGTPAFQQGRKLGSGSKSLALGPWPMSFFLLLFKNFAIILRNPVFQISSFIKL